MDVKLLKDQLCVFYHSYSANVKLSMKCKYLKNLSITWSVSLSAQIPPATLMLGLFMGSSIGSSAPPLPR